MTRCLDICSGIKILMQVYMILAHASIDIVGLISSEPVEVFFLNISTINGKKLIILSLKAFFLQKLAKQGASYLS